MLHCQGMSGEELRSLADVNALWSRYDCVLCTPAVTVGVSFDVPDHFDHLMVYGSSHSCCVRDAMQATQRVRKFRSDVMYFCAYSRPPQRDSARRPDTVWAIERDIGWSARNVERLCSELGVRVRSAEQLHPAVLRVEVLNRLEENCSKRYYRQVWDAYLEHIGYDVVEEGANAAEDEVGDEVAPLAATLSSSTTLRYADIPPLAPDATTLSVLSARVRTKRASEVEQAQFDRWCFSHFVGGDNAELRARLYDEVWTQPAKRHWLRNLRAEKRGLAASEAEFRAREAGKESAFVGKTLDQLLAIQELCEELGVANNGTAAVVTRSALISAATPDDLERRMELRPAQGRGRSSELRLKLSIFSRALEAWSGARLMCGPRARRRVDGKVLDASDFRLVPALDGAAWAALSP